MPLIVPFSVFLLVIVLILIWFDATFSRGIIQRVKADQKIEGSKSYEGPALTPNQRYLD